MPRVQAIVIREGRVLMVRHRHKGDAWWCLPGGGQEPGETPEQGALRELREECCVLGTVVRQTSALWYGPGDETLTFLVEIGGQEPSLGRDPGVAPGQEVLVDLRWLRLSEIPERDRAYLWAAGLLGTGRFAHDVEHWGDRISYPDEEGPGLPGHAKRDPAADPHG